MHSVVQEKIMWLFQVQSLEDNVGIMDDPIWAAVVEDEKVEDAFLSAAFHQSFLEGNFNQVPLLYSFVSEEILLFISS